MAKAVFILLLLSLRVNTCTSGETVFSPIDAHFQSNSPSPCSITLGVAYVGVHVCMCVQMTGREKVLFVCCAMSVPGD